ncbi:hypothetical protein K2173_003229 [Erythroxylum novogranatense]|uniref:protein-disulfide reductase n=1 Tax=Erythroxylum novogranatense TaxID=1862640 RepID=A0AAV8SX02_9ROSI|nr:hypothetical protein K2173_003229 [Erythroxylum novogranatense]
MAESAANAISQELPSLLSSDERDFLINSKGDEVKISNLVGKIVALYFSASWCPPCRRFTPVLMEVYEQLSSKGNFEVVFISSDRDDDSFNAYFTKMPWLAIPFADSVIRKHVKELFKVTGIPNLHIFDSDGKISSNQGVNIIKDYGAEAYPFSLEKLDCLRVEQENVKKNQNLSSLLVSKSRDYLISNCGTKVFVSELQGKMVGLYFSVHSHPICLYLTPKVVKAYEKLKEKGENFDVVLVSLDYEEDMYKKDFETMPWLALPFGDKSHEKLARYFEIRALPTMVIIGEDGKTLNQNVVELVEDHGDEAYPFTPEKLVELAEIQKEKLEAQTLESVLVHGEKDFVIDKSYSKVLVSELVGKTILLYFSAQSCRPCRAFLPKLTKVYHEIKAKDNAFEIIFVSSDLNQASFDDIYSCMPWLTLPFEDERNMILQRKFRIPGIPEIVAMGPSGRTVSTKAYKHIANNGVGAYPFTEEHFKQLDEKIEEMAKGWPKKIKHQLHPEHELILTKLGSYGCDNCNEFRHDWSFNCKKCGYDLDPKCALKIDEREAAKSQDGWICDGVTCRKA